MGVLAEAPLILASQSERRRVLLSTLGLPFFVAPPGIDETPFTGERPGALCVRLAEAKAAAVAAARGLTRGTVVGADTIVVLGSRIIGKPRDEADARSILRSLSGTLHSVLTGVAVLRLGARRAASGFEETRVRLRPLNESEIEEYVASGEAMGKAGAYAIQERGDRFVESIDGAFDNVVGLPVELLRGLLAKVSS